MREDRITRNSLATQVHAPKVILRITMALVGSHLVQPNGLLEILDYAATLFVQRSKVLFRIRIV